MKLSLRQTLLVGTSLRLILLPITAHPADVWSWYTICMTVLKDGLNIHQMIYSLRPLWFFTLGIVANIYDSLSSFTSFSVVSVSELPIRMNPQYGITVIPDPLFNVLVKTPIFLADIAITILLYKAVNQFLGNEKANEASSLYFLNPIVIWISSAWGQYEAIPAFFTVLSMYLLVNGKIKSSSFSLVLATLYKTYPALFLIPASIYLYKRKENFNLLKYCIIFFSPVLIAILWNGIDPVNIILRFFTDFVSTSV